jgi:RimJ/RimL family protein N-acetyltransferase
LESAILSFGVGFDNLSLDMANVDVRVENTHAEAFYRRLGMTETHRTEQYVSVVYSRAQFGASKDVSLSILKQEDRNG